MRIVYPTFILSLLVAFNACVSTANRPLVASEIVKFKENKSTRSEVVAIYGEPQSEGISGNLQNLCYLSMSDGRRLLFMQFNDKDLLVTKNFEDKKAREECGTLGANTGYAGAPSTFGGAGSVGSSNCNIPDGTDQYGRPKTRCADDAGSASRNFGANTGQNCNIYDGTDSYGRPKYRCM